MIRIIILKIQNFQKLNVMNCIHPVTVYKGHFIRDTFLRVVDFQRKIKDQLVSSLQDLRQIVIFLWPITRHANGMQMRIAGASSTGKQGQEQTSPNLIKGIFFSTAYLPFI